MEFVLFKKSSLDESQRLRVEIAILRQAIFRASPEIANAYRKVITEIFESPAELEQEMIEFLAELASEANEAAGIPTFL